MQLQLADFIRRSIITLEDHCHRDHALDFLNVRDFAHCQRRPGDVLLSKSEKVFFAARLYYTELLHHVCIGGVPQLAAREQATSSKVARF